MHSINWKISVHHIKLETLITAQHGPAPTCMLMLPCIWECLVHPNSCLSSTAWLRKLQYKGPLGWRASKFSFTWRTLLVPGGGETLKLSLQWNLGQQTARSAGCENRPLLGKLCCCCITSCYPLSVLFFVSMAACCGKGPSRCPDTCTPLWGQCHNLFWATLCCCFLMLPCQLWTVEPVCVLSSPF